MGKRSPKVLATIIMLAMVLSPLASTSPAIAQSHASSNPLRAIPDEVQAIFDKGITVDDFLAQNKGPIPEALLPYTHRMVAVIVEMNGPSLVQSMESRSALAPISSSAQKAYVSSLMQAQAPVVAQIQAHQGTVLGQYTKVYNGVLTLIPGEQLQSLRSVPGVKTLHRAPVNTVELTNSVPLIRADKVWNSVTPPGNTGTGVRVAVIDTGIDYTHASFGGSGGYAANNPAIIEPGSFPTAKVVGGYDFAGTYYDADTNPIPVPDPDPLDEAGHGTHVASTVAGEEVSNGSSVLVGSGVAPGASLYALKVFGAEGTTNLVVNALEWAVDPNQDGDVSDHVDVINMSLGSTFSPASNADPEVVAVDNLSSLGVIVVCSAGNSYDNAYVTGTPGASSSAISVAASADGFVTYPSVKFDGDAQNKPYAPAIAYDEATTATLVDVDTVDGSAVGDLCMAGQVSPGALEGKIALIARGSCPFEIKIDNAEALGAVGVLIFNNAGDTYVNMATGFATLPAGFMTQSDGLLLRTFNDTTVTVGPDSDVTSFPLGLVDTVASFSSRGPRGYDSLLKPEITAPGVAIYAARMGSTNEGISLDGTSMASPHVAGVAALVRKAHPDWTVEEVKAAIMSTAVDLNVADSYGYREVPRTGAGRVDAYNSVFTDALAIGDPQLVSLSYGEIEVGADTSAYVVPQAKQVRLENKSASSKTYHVSVVFSDPAHMVGALFTVPPIVTVGAHSALAVPVSLTLDPTQLPLDANGHLEEYYGYLFFKPDAGPIAPVDPSNLELRVPFYFVPRPYTSLTQQPGAVTEMSYNGVPGASVTFHQSGPQASSLGVWPVMVTMPNDPNVEDMGELRMAGFSQRQFNGNNYVSLAIANWGPVYDLQPYFNENDVYIDYDQDGIFDYILFNYNYTSLTGESGQSNRWCVALLDLSGLRIYLGSDRDITADFNSGLQVWDIPAAYLTRFPSTRFDYLIVAYDENGAQQITPLGTFDDAKLPYTYSLTTPAPYNTATTLTASVNSMYGVMISKPKGLMIFDDNGKPGFGQAYFVDLSINDAPTYFLPMIGK